MRTTFYQYKSLQFHHLLIKFHKSVNGFSNFNQIKKTHFRKLQIPLEITNFGTPKCELFLLSFSLCVKQNLVYLDVCFSKITVKISIICTKSTWITELIKENIFCNYWSKLKVTDKNRKKTEQYLKKKKKKNLWKSNIFFFKKKKLGQFGN